MSPGWRFTLIALFIFAVLVGLDTFFGDRVFVQFVRDMHRDVAFYIRRHFG